MNQFGYTLISLGVASAAFAFLNWFSPEPINTVGWLHYLNFVFQVTTTILLKNSLETDLVRAGFCKEQTDTQKV